MKKGDFILLKGQIIEIDGLSVKVRTGKHLKKLEKTITQDFWINQKERGVIVPLKQDEKKQFVTSAFV